MARARARYTLEAEDRTDRGLRSAEGRLRGFTRVVSGTLRTAFAGVTAAIAGWATAIATSTRRLDEFAKRAKDVGNTLAEQASIDLFAGLQGTTPQAVNAILERIQGFRGRVALERPGGEGRRLLDAIGLSPDDLGGGLQGFGNLAIALRRAPAELRTRARREIAGEGTGRVFAGDVFGNLQRAGQLGLTENVGELARTAEEAADLWAEFKALLERRVDEATLGGTGGEITLEALRLARDVVAQPLDFQGVFGGGRESGRFNLAEEANRRNLQFLADKAARDEARESARGSTAGTFGL